MSVLERVSLILGAFRIEDRTLGVTELARRTGLAKSTVSRLTAELVRLQYLERHGAALRLGIALFELGQLAATPKELRRRAMAIMADLRNATGQTVHLAVLDGHEVVYIEILRGRGTPRLPSRVGGRLPAHVTAVGKCMLAASPPSALEAVLARGLTRVGPATIIDEYTLRQQLAASAKKGLAYEENESARDSSCVASPVLDGGGAVVAALSLSGKVGELDIPRAAPAVRTAALVLGRQLPRFSVLDEK